MPRKTKSDKPKKPRTERPLKYVTKADIAYTKKINKARAKKAYRNNDRIEALRSAYKATDMSYQKLLKHTKGMSTIEIGKMG